MTDYEFAELQKEIQETMLYLDRLQKEYIRQTGKKYIPERYDLLKKADMEVPV